MGDLWTQTLFSAAEFSSFASGLGVIICFVCMVIFIMRIQGMEGTPSSVVHFQQPGAAQIKCQKVGVPFTCAISPTKDPSIEELPIEITTKVACTMQALWHISADKLHSILYLPWNDFVRQIDDKDCVDALQHDPICDLVANKPDELPHIIKLNLNHDLPPLGNAPRSRFPLLLLFKRTSWSSEDVTEVGALIAIIHLSDVECPMKSTILFQYLKQYSGQVTHLKPLYTQRREGRIPNGESLNAEVTESPSGECTEDLFANFNLREDESCVVCRVMRPTRALLPCRHVCVCSNCFSHLDLCPMCRSKITAFFLTDPKEEESQEEVLWQEKERNSQEELNIARHRSFLNNMNRVLNSLLGINE